MLLEASGDGQPVEELGRIAERGAQAVPEDRLGVGGGARPQRRIGRLGGGSHA